MFSEETPNILKYDDMLDDVSVFVTIFDENSSINYRMLLIFIWVSVHHAKVS
jgi:hypothetical protein